MRVPVRLCPVPSPSLLDGSLARIHYADAFEARFDSAAELGVEDAFRSFFGTAPRPVVLLLRVRNALVRRLGLKAPGPEGLDAASLPIAPGVAFGLFKVYAVAPAEILAGEDDRHLDFRVVVRLEGKAGSGYRLTVATVVDFKNRFGRLYFAPVRIFHKLIVPAMLRAMARSLMERPAKARP